MVIGIMMLLIGPFKRYVTLPRGVGYQSIIHDTTHLPIHKLADSTQLDYPGTAIHLSKHLSNHKYIIKLTKIISNSVTHLYQLLYASIAIGVLICA